MDHIKKMMSMLGEKEKAGFDRITPVAPKKKTEELYGIFPSDGKPYDMLDIIQCIVDDSEFEQFKEDYGKTIICGYGRIDGWAVGIVANQRLIVKAKKAGGNVRRGSSDAAATEMQLGGVIYNDSADKAARFILNCNQKKIPLVFLQDVTGFMVGSR